MRLAANSADTTIAVFFDIVPSFPERVVGEESATTPKKACHHLSALSAPVVVIVACVRMIFVKVIVQVPQGAMIRTVLGSAVETLLMSAPVRLVYFPVEPVVSRVIACVSTVVVVIVVGQGRRSSCGQRQRCGHR